MRKIGQIIYFLLPTAVLTYGCNIFLPYLVNLLHGKEGETLFHFDIYVVVSAFLGISTLITLFILEKNLFPKWWKHDIEEANSQKYKLEEIRRVAVYAAVLFFFPFSFLGLFSLNNYIRISNQTISASNFSLFNNEKTYSYNQVKVYTERDRKGQLRTRFIFNDGKDIGSIEGESRLASMIVDKQNNLGIIQENLPDPGTSNKASIPTRIITFLFSIGLLLLIMKIWAFFRSKISS